MMKRRPVDVEIKYIEAESEKAPKKTDMFKRQISCPSIAISNARKFKRAKSTSDVLSKDDGKF